MKRAGIQKRPGNPRQQTVCPYCHGTFGTVVEVRAHLSKCPVKKIGLIDLKIAAHQEELHALQRAKSKLEKEQHA